MTESNPPERLNDITLYREWSDVAKNVERIGARFVAVAAWFRENKERSEHNLLIHNLVSAAGPYFGLAAREIEGPAQVLALATRSVYELLLRTIHVLEDPANMEHWKAEFVRDNIELLEGLLRLETKESAAAGNTIRAELARQKEVAKRHQIDVKTKLLGISDLAKKTGRTAEHQAMFKLYSKVVHPTSYLVNRSSGEVHGPQVRNILAIHLQLYGEEMLHRIATHAAVPDHIAAPRPKEDPSQPPPP